MNNEMRDNLADIDDVLADICNRIADAARIEDKNAGDLWGKKWISDDFMDADKTQRALHEADYHLQSALVFYRRAMKCKR